MILAIPKSAFKTFPENCKLQFYTKSILCGSLDLVRSEAQHASLIIFSATGSELHLLNFFQRVFQLAKQLRRNKNLALYPSSSEYNQIRVAYSFPRNISVLIVEKDKTYNIFPTDLHGAIAKEEQYTISLRENGLAYKQILEASTISLSNVSSKYFQNVYSLGKNHMKGMVPFRKISHLLNVPEPNFPYYSYKNCNNCIALRKNNELKIGIHNLMTFSIVDRIDHTKNLDSLSHIHEFYALWRNRHEFKDRLLIRAKNH